MKKLPVGIQTFAEIIQEGYLYVDKTQKIAELIASGKYIFLSRPRRFGKSLLISTLAEIFSGHQTLFKGLAIADQLEWQSYPVIKVDFSVISCEDAQIFKTSLMGFLDETAADHGLTLTKRYLKDKFAELIKKLQQKNQQKVVILVDEYDKPIISHLENLARAHQNRDILRDFFSVLKASDPYIKFAFLTGVSKFARISIFSELNNLRDITLSPQFASLAGYTQTELETYFAQHIQDCCHNLHLTQTELLAQIKTWYNGYSWDAQTQVYNPFSILCFFTEYQFDNYWFATGTPILLMKLIKQKNYDVTALENQTVPKIVFDSYDIESMNIHALLFQTGYLTIIKVNQVTEIIGENFIEYTLNYPNNEVKQAFMAFLMNTLTENDLSDIQPATKRLLQALQRQDLDTFMTLIRALFAKIPYPLHLEYEAYYHSLFYMIAVLMGVEIDLEILTDKGRIDGVLELPDKIYLLEFKYGKAGTNMENLIVQAIEQMRVKRYSERYADDVRPLWLLGIGVVDKTLEYGLCQLKTETSASVNAAYSTVNVQN